MDCRRLVLHIGLPKTGSTTLQYSVLARMHHLVYVHQFVSQECKTLLRDLRLHVRDQTVRRGDVHDRVAAAIGHRADRLPEAGIVLSNENVTLRPNDLWHGDGPPPEQVAQRLVDWVERAGVPLERARVLLGVRRQDQWLASRYAESAKHNREFGQADFDTRMKAIAESDAEGPWTWLEYDRVHAIFDRAFDGRTSYLVAERLRDTPEQALGELERTLDVGGLVGAYTRAAESGASTQRNALSTAPNVWQLRHRDELLRLDEDTQERLHRRYAAANARFAEHLGTDLAVYGY